MTKESKEIKEKRGISESMYLGENKREEIIRSLKAKVVLLSGNQYTESSLSSAP